MAKKAVELKKKNYTIQVNYSPKAKKEKLMKFIPKANKSFEISANEMASILVGQLNSEELAATFVESDRIHVVDVTRQIRVVTDRDIKKGEEIRLEYTHPYPIEFAIIEEGMKIAKINRDKQAFTLTAEFLDSVKKKTTKEQKRFIEKFYAFFRDLLRKKK